MSAVQTPPIPADVLAFCREQGVVEVFNRAVRLLQEAFPGCPVEISLMEEDSPAGACVILDVEVRGDWREVLARHDAFLHRWAAGEISYLIRPTVTPIDP